jgi:FkbM family methyltransferase
VRLAREGDVFTGSVSPDGRNWSEIDRFTIPMASGVCIGLAVTSLVDGALCIAKFDHVSVAGTLGLTDAFPNPAAAPASWRGEDIGSVAAPGAYALSRGRFTVSGSGADIWGPLDSFQFVSSGLIGDGSITARVVSLTETDGWAKAGVMIRATRAPDSANALVALTPAHGAVLQARTTINGGPITGLTDRAGFLNGEGRHGEVLTELTPFLSTHPLDHWLNFQLASAYEGLGYLEKAMEHFLAAARSDYAFRVGALYNVVRLDLGAARFDRTEWLDAALRLPGDVAARDEAGTQKRFYFSSLKFLRALSLLKAANYRACESQLDEVYAFDKAIDARKFAFPWLIDLLRDLVIEPGMVNLAYLRERLLGTHSRVSISYAQELDAVADGACVLEIGAMDGVRYDALHPHLVRRKWHATVVEPLPDMFVLLRRNYSAYPWVRCVNVAITERSGPLTLFRVDPEKAAERGIQDWLLGISSAFRSSNLAYLHDIVSEQTVTGMRFEEFVREFSIDRIDVLQIDTEGYDWRILQQIDLDRWDIGLIQIEIINLMPRDRLKVFAYLEAARYVLSYDGQDVTAVRPRR